EVLPTLAALARGGPADKTSRPGAPGELADVLKTIQTNLHRALVAARGPAASEMASLALILDDGRLRRRLADACAAPAPLRALSELARAYARVPFSGAPGAAGSADVLGDRAAEIEDLCVLAFGSVMSGRPMVRSGAIVVSERLGLFSTL